MRRAVLFIISAFIFSACAHHVTDKEFEDFADVLKKADAKSDATASSHLKLTKENMAEIATLKEQFNQTKMLTGSVILQLGRLDQATAQWFILVLKALEYKGVKLDLKKTWERMQKEEMEKKLKEKVK